jgi:hypothetical protein
MHLPSAAERPRLYAVGSVALCADRVTAFCFTQSPAWYTELRPDIAHDDQESWLHGEKLQDHGFVRQGCQRMLDLMVQHLLRRGSQRIGFQA